VSESLRANAARPHTGFSAKGVSSDELLVENQRLVQAPVEVHRQATTGAAFGGAVHVCTNSSKIFGQIQSKYTVSQDVATAIFDS
jgi:hypothetical protein